MNKKTYTYTKEIEIDFDTIVDIYNLSKKTPLSKCERCVDDYISGFDDGEYYIIDNKEEIAQDLYNYLQENADDSAVSEAQKELLFGYLVAQYDAEDLKDFDLDCCLEAVDDYAADWLGFCPDDEDFDDNELARDFYEYLKNRK